VPTSAAATAAAAGSSAGCRRAQRSGFTMLEMLVSLGIFALLAFAAWEIYIGGTKQTASASEHLTAMQSAMILMESIQEDVRQISLLNKYAMPLVPFSMLFSTNGKSFMMRRSTLKDTRGSEIGSSFTVVVYQLLRHPSLPGAFAIRRLERTTDGRPLPTTGREEEEKAFRSLVLQDVRFDFVVRLENMAYRTFIRVSVTAANTTAGARDAKVFFISNVFEISSPEFIHNEPGSPGFARRFVMSNRWNLGATNAVKPGDGYFDVLPPTSWPDFSLFSPFRDYLDGSAPTDFPTAVTAAAIEPFRTTGATSGTGYPPLRRAFLTSSVRYMENLLSKDFRGRITGAIASPPRVAPPWTEPFSFNATWSTTQPLVAQVDELLRRVIPRGKEAVAEMGHTFYAQVPPSRPDMMISTDQAQLIVDGR
jgi:prepilin-type N-terminal cleavage/methylation domain-containing protein